MLFAFAFSVDEDVIKVHYHENIELLCQNLVDVTIKSAWYVGQSKRHHLILEMTIAGPEDCFLFIVFSDLYSMVGIS